MQQRECETSLSSLYEEKGLTVDERGNAARPAAAADVRVMAVRTMVQPRGGYALGVMPPIHEASEPTGTEGG